jgi:tripartite-type tricarboxylate transporter receptor subunit TctC
MNGETGLGRVGLGLASGVIAGMLVASSALAQAFPSKPIRILIPSAPGAGADTVLRLMIPSMEKALGQPIVLDNRAGGGGLLAASGMVGQAPDGHTIMIGYISTISISPVIEKNLPYVAERDFTPIARLFDVNLIIDARKDFPANNLKELEALAKASPGKLTFGHSGNFGAPHIGMELFKKAAGVDILSVPYRGEPPAMAALLSKETDLAMVTMAGLSGHLKEGTVKILAQLGTKRSAGLPDVPTAIEQGYPSVLAYSWVGSFAPAKTPPEVVNKWATVMADALKLPAVQERLKAVDYIANGDGPEAFAKFIESENKKWKDLILSSKLIDLVK